MSRSPRVVAITGAAGGLGRALCAQLLTLGDTVIALDFDQQALQQLNANSACTQLHTRELDVSDEHAINACFAEIKSQFGRLDVLINNAGITQISAVEDITAAVLDKVMQVNFRGAALVAIAATELLRASRGSHVVISSVAGFSPLSKRSIYCASKHALAGFYATLRAEERVHGVHVLLVSPSFIATNIGRLEPQQQIQRPGAADDAVDQMQPTQAADAILRALDRQQENLYLGRVAKISSLIQRLSPRLFEWLMRRSIQAENQQA